jgi:hypothetical protein
MAKFTIYETSEYTDWLETQTLKSQRQIHRRLLNIEQEGHFDHHKYLEEIKMGKIKTSKKRQRSLAKSTNLDLDKVPGLTRAQPLKSLLIRKKLLWQYWNVCKITIPKEQWR